MEIISSIAQVSLPLTDMSQVGEVRRAAKLLSDRLEFSAEQAGKLAIVVTEVATNLVHHAKQGEVLLCPHVRDDNENRIDVIAVDRGPGIPDISRSMDDGFSTAGTPGNGLGAIKRLAEEFELYSQAGSGTVLLARVFSRPETRSADPPCLAAGFICLPVKGEEVSGDTVAFRTNTNHGLFMVADGLGHGTLANEASLQAGKLLLEDANSAPAELLDSLHHGLRATRGAAVAVALIDCESKKVRYSGIGNIASAIFQAEGSRSLISHNGIVGHQSHKIQEFSYEWPASGVLVMNSDGLVTNWKLNQYPGLLQKDPALIAAVLYRDFSRGRDDVAVLVVKETRDA